MGSTIFLAGEVASGRTPLLLIDEAQDLQHSVRPDRDMLGLIKTLTNMMLENQRLIHIVLFGQLELIPLLKVRRELMSRVAQFGVLSPLTKEDAIAMMEHRWKVAGGQLPLPFEDEALDVLYHETRGLPRSLIKAANATLVHAYANRLKKAGVESVRFAIKEQLLDLETNVQ